ncbi:MAG TPA: MauE/DoxX family redox-associated membrane protein, partial [Solirubrobacteraceae bacterium]|nr:MauE/DoxX family redox-associated membrane protein [Solirubrobacteraceae bacterium]
MPKELIGGLLAAVFLVAALQKAVRPRATATALGTYGVPEALRSPVLVAAIVIELALAVGLAAGLPLAAWAGAALALGFAALTAGMLRSGRAGAPCACFGPGSRLTRWSVGRNLALAAALAGTPLLPDTSLNAQAWLAIGLGVALAAVLALGVAVAALAREVGLLRRELVPAPALEIPNEGPPLGARTSLIERFRLGPRATWALAVFSSPGCQLCQ